MTIVRTATPPPFPGGDQEPGSDPSREGEALHSELASFNQFGKPTSVCEKVFEPGIRLPVFANEFWTSKQRAGHPLHEISFRACFKSELPAFFIDRLTRPGDVVHDPFMGRGTTPLEAALRGRVPFGCDVSPLGGILAAPRLAPPEEDDVAERLEGIDLGGDVAFPDDLLVFYHRETLREIASLRSHLMRRERESALDGIDRWIRMVATNRLTGHSPGFLSVRTLPPNQAATVAAQRRINERRGQVPPRRDVRAVILKKTRSLLRRCTAEDRSVLAAVRGRARLLTASCQATPEIPSGSVSLVVTSPPFLDVVDYRRDNWLRCWFNGIDPSSVGIWRLRDPVEWQRRMTAAFRELRRVLRPGGHVAFEVGEVRRGTVRLEDLAVPAGAAAGLEPLLVMINDQEFTKTSHCWGVDNGSKGTNTNRIVLFGRD